MSDEPAHQQADETDSYLPLQPWYVEGPEAPEGPGEPPFTRGLRRDGYRSRLWTMRQYAGFGSAKATNARFHYLLQQGQSGLSVAFDLPTQTGFDSDAEEARGEVGRVGVAIDT
ncbi:MAG: methylmalonyl-CoA mutase family protein, partial [Candidatus Dormibacteria bacterium]